MACAIFVWKVTTNEKGIPGEVLADRSGYASGKRPWFSVPWQAWTNRRSVWQYPYTARQTPREDGRSVYIFHYTDFGLGWQGKRASEPGNQTLKVTIHWSARTIWENAAYKSITVLGTAFSKRTTFWKGSPKQNSLTWCSVFSESGWPIADL